MSSAREFCTLFDSGYLFKALALYGSLERHCERFHLTALCFDEEAERLLWRLALPRLRPAAGGPRGARSRAARDEGGPQPFEYC